MCPRCFLQANSQEVLRCVSWDENVAILLTMWLGLNVCYQRIANSDWWWDYGRTCLAKHIWTPNFQSNLYYMLIHAGYTGISEQTTALAHWHFFLMSFSEQQNLFDFDVLVITSVHNTFDVKNNSLLIWNLIAMIIICSNDDSNDVSSDQLNVSLLSTRQHVRVPSTRVFFKPSGERSATCSWKSPWNTLRPQNNWMVVNLAIWK